MGILMMSLMPGGPNSAIYSQLAGGVPAINGATTVLSSLVSIGMVPLLCYVVVDRVMQEHPVRIGYGSLVFTSACVVASISGGACLRYYASHAFESTVTKVLHWLYLPLFVVFIFVLALPGISKDRLVAGALLAACGHIVGIAMGIGTFASCPQVISLAFELSIHDMPLALAIISNSFRGNEAFLRGACGTAVCTSLLANIIALLIAGLLLLFRKFGFMKVKKECEIRVAASDDESYGAAEVDKAA